MGREQNFEKVARYNLEPHQKSLKVSFYCLKITVQFQEI